ncbi:MAG: hypothetical protein NTW87_17450 [Planctomycetota bacterium]|nr:hypothetical protein [Planctomycetota bacterium]
MTHRGTLCFVALALWADPLLGAAPVGNLVPLKGDMLDGSRLVLRAAGCSIDRPGADWKWITYEGNAGQNYLCANSATGALFLVAVGKLHGEFTDHQPQSLIDNARKAVTARGGRLEHDKFEWLDLPGAKKCVRVSFHEVEKSGTKTMAVIYIAQTIGEVSLKQQYTGAGDTEPEAFKQMVRSLKMLPDSAAPAPKDPGK